RRPPRTLARHARPATRRFGRGAGAPWRRARASARRARPAPRLPAPPRGRRAHPRAAPPSSPARLWTGAAGAPYKGPGMATMESEPRAGIEGFPALWQRVVTAPHGFFADMPQTGGLGEPTIFLALVYSAYLMLRGLERVQAQDTTRAALTLVISLAILWILARAGRPIGL